MTPPPRRPRRWSPRAFGVVVRVVLVIGLVAMVAWPECHYSWKVGMIPDSEVTLTRCAGWVDGAILARDSSLGVIAPR